jgi:S1 RNA binding domain
MSSYLDGMDKDELQLAIWRLFLERTKAKTELEQLLDQGDSVAVTAAEETLATLPDVSALDALRANAELITRLSTERWIAMRVAQDEGANLEQIGSELGVTRQAAWEFMKRKIEEHGGDLSSVQPREEQPDDRWVALGQRLEQAPGTVSDEPWERFVSTHHEVDVVDGVVTKVVPFGVFVEVEGIPGLIVRSNLGDMPEVGTSIRATITTLDHANRRMSLVPVPL